MSITRLGIIGAGGFGLFCLDKCRYIPDVRVTAVADLNANLLVQLSNQFELAFTTTDWRELIDNPEVDVVHIATPPFLHAEQAMYAARAGKHPFCEKPLAVTMEEADEIFTTAQQHDVRVGINFVMRYSTLYDAVRTITFEGLLGKPVRLLFENHAKDLPPKHWFWDPKLSGAIPVEHGVHFFDIFSSIFGPGKIRWAGRTCRQQGEEDKWMIVMQYGDQMLGYYYHGFYKPASIEHTWAEIEYERGRIILEGWIPERLRLDGVGTMEDAERLCSILPTAEMRLLPEAEMEILSNGQELTVSHGISADVSAGEKQAIYGRAVQDAMADFIAWTRNPSYRPRVTGEEGRTALRVALDVVDMARTTSEQPPSRKKAA